MATAFAPRSTSRPGTVGRVCAVALLAVIVVQSALAIPLTRVAGSGHAAGQGVSYVVAFSAVGFVVAFRQPRNSIGWMLMGIALFFVLNDEASLYSNYDYNHHGGTLPLGALSVVLQISWAPAIVLMGMTILLFPDAKLPPGRWRWILVGFLGIGALWMCGALAIAGNAIATHSIHVESSGDLVQIDHPTGAFRWWGYVQDIWFPTLGVCLLASLCWQVVALRRATGIRRAQLKWLVVGASVFGVGGFLAIADGNAYTGWEFVFNIAGGVMLLALPISIGVGIMRYRLFEIDRFLSRTLSYAIVTGLLVGVYVGIIALATQVLSFSSSVAVAPSTLAAAALFNPVRKRVQHRVDRHFNRTRYDAEATVAEFRSHLREAVELDVVRRELLDVVRRAVEPSAVTIWVRPSV